MDFCPPPQFENCGGHRKPKFYTDYPDNGVHKRCAAIFIFCVIVKMWAFNYADLCKNDRKWHIFRQKWPKNYFSKKTPHNVCKIPLRACLVQISAQKV